MANNIIHGFEVEYDSQSETIKSYLNHLENNLSKEELKAVVDDAKHNELKKIHLEDRYNNRFTLEYKDDKSFLLRKSQY